MQVAGSVGRDELHSAGICIGKFTHSKKFRLQITALEYLSQYAKYKVWVKPTSEMSYLYGNHILKSGLGRITENTPKYQGVVIYNMQDVPLGFGLAAASTEECRTMDPATVAIFHQADVGEYLREEEILS